jgi:hypothetical protein
MLRRMLRLNYLPLVFLAALLAMPAQAAGPKSLGKSGFWSSYSLGEGKQAVCYMSLSAKPPQPKNVSKAAKRGEVVLMITHRPAEDATDVVSYTAGLKFKPSSDVALKIGAKQFDLFTQGDTAWSRDAATDHALAAAIRAGQSLTITGVAASGAPIADTLNLKGADAAYVTVGKACGLKVEEPKPAPKKPAKNSAAVKHK